MIDYEKIEKACDKALKNSVFNDNAHAYPYVRGFYDCAKWAINEFLKDLWHPASEEPRQKAMLLIEISLPKLTPRKSYYVDILIGEDWEITCGTMSISRWLYIDDLLPKEALDVWVDNLNKEGGE